MEQSYQQMLQEYQDAYRMEVKKGPNSMDFLMYTPEGLCTTSIFDVLPFVHLVYFDIRAHAIPNEGGPGSGGHMTQLNYCLRGKTELMLDDDTYLYMGPHDFCISDQNSQGETYFPLKYYQGAAVCFEDDFFTSGGQLNTLFVIDPRQLQDLYLSGGTFLGEASAGLRDIMERLWKLYVDPEIFQKKLCVLELLHCLLSQHSPCQEKNCVFYTNTQVEIAKKAEQLLTADLSRHIPIRTVAQQFGISETSLKNYFRGVYGANISAYLRTLRLRSGEELLRTTDLSVAEIAYRVGYTKQGKFAEIFKAQFGQSPLEYRRTQQLKNIK